VPKLDWWTSEAAGEKSVPLFDWEKVSASFLNPQYLGTINSEYETVKPTVEPAVEPTVLYPERWPTSEYLGQALQRRWRSELINQLVTFLQDKSHLFDAIAFRGMSGALIGPVLADRLDKKLIMVRKPTDGESHSRMTVEGEKADRYIIVDDFVSSGSTVRAIIQALVHAEFTDQKPIAVMAYLPHCGRSQTHVDDIPIWRTE
jgi:hypothetical protein